MAEPWVCIFCAQLIDDARTVEQRWDHLLDFHREELINAEASSVISRQLSTR